MAIKKLGIPLALASLALIAALAPATPDPAEANKALARVQLKMIDEALEHLNKLVRGGEVTFGSPQFDLWIRRRFEALRRSGATKSEMIDALERYRKQTIKDEEDFNKLHEMDQVDREEMIAIRYRRIEAEVWLNEEKAR